MKPSILSQAEAQQALARGRVVLVVSADEIPVYSYDPTQPESRAARLAVDAAVKRLKLLPYQRLPSARVDSHRALRTGFPEVIFCQSKEPRDIEAIARASLDAE